MANFTPYVDLDGEKKLPAAISTRLNSSSLASPFVNRKKQIDLLPGEIESCSSDNVSFSFQFEESEQGRVFCTDVRLRFVPSVPKSRELPQRSTFFEDFYDVPLCAISNIKALTVKNSAKGKTNKFENLDYFSTMKVISRLRLTLKDMRVVTIDFRQSQNGTGLANQISYFSKCRNIDKMTQIGAGLPNKGKGGKLPFNSYDSWDNEMKRCGLRTDSSSPWRICALHKEGFSNSAQDYPMYIVLPTFLSRTDIDRQMQNWKNGRIPVWVWSKSNGNAALMIGAEHETNLATPEILAKLNESISRTHSKESKPHIVHLEKRFQSNIGLAFKQLQKLCAIDSYEQFVSRMSSWYSELNSSGWLQLINDCMKITNEAVNYIVDKDRSVVLLEEEGKDMSLVVASLVQICSDSYYRTTLGFQELIEKMWISFGHPFGERLLGRCLKAKMNKSFRNTFDKSHVFPTWLLFLDCVGQLIRINELEFSFSSHFLIAIWDVSLTGLIPSFTCNSLSEQLSVGIGGKTFPLDLYYSKQYTEWFDNVWHEAAMFTNSIRKKKPISEKVFKKDILRPPHAICDIHLWSECFLRWIPAANLKNSGKPSEILMLHEKCERMARWHENVEWIRRIHIPKNYSSAYPYSLPEIEPEVQNYDFEYIDRPTDFDAQSLTSSFCSLNFTQTPNSTISMFDQSRNSNTNSERTPNINVQTSSQVVRFSKYDNVDSDDENPKRETPILKPSYTPVRPIHTNNRETPSSNKSLQKPIPPPRPADLTIRSSITKVRIDQSPNDESNAVTRF